MIRNAGSGKCFRRPGIGRGEKDLYVVKAIAALAAIDAAPFTARFCA
jgi:hypothetical protein